MCDLTLDVPRGQIMVLLGGKPIGKYEASITNAKSANGSGKSTTLDCIAGLQKITSGTVAVDGTGGIGITPQANVLWNDLTTMEHVWIFDRLKSVEKPAAKEELKTLVKDCDLSRKSSTKSCALSGGQKRKLQLAMMFAGGSRVCCVDEASSGVDPLARRSLWNILLRERGRRTILLTTHFLDEADLLSDQIAILSKGALKAAGTSVELKHQLGGGFRVHVNNENEKNRVHAPPEGIEMKDIMDQVVYTLPSSYPVADFIRWLDERGIEDYEISSPTVEEIFFKVAESPVPSMPLSFLKSSDDSSPQATNLSPPSDDAIPIKGHDLQLQNGKTISAFHQSWALFRKRWTVFQRNYLPYAAAFVIPIIAAGLVSFLLNGFQFPGCAPGDQVYVSDIESLVTQQSYSLVAGPVERLGSASFNQIESTLPEGAGTSGKSNLSSNTLEVRTLNDFNSYIVKNYQHVSPGGFFLGEQQSPPTFAYKGNADPSTAIIIQNAFDNLITNISISTQFQAFDIPFPTSLGKTLQLLIYFGLAMAAYPALFSLYPTLERLRQVRQLHYSNGVSSLALWSAYVTFDFIIVFITSVIATVIFRGVTDQWYNIGYLFVAFFLYGFASTLLCYVVSLFCRSQLASFAFAAGGQAVFFLLYFIAYLNVLTYAPVDKVDNDLIITHFAFSIITPTGSLIRALFLALNIFSTTCQGRPSHLISYPGSILAYGGPILYLVLQSVLLFAFLIWHDSGSLWARFRRKMTKMPDGEQVTEHLPEDVASEIKRVKDAKDDGLRVEHVSKAFGKNLAVQDVTFGVRRGEVFALLGPNGAGKSTTISLIRGDILPSKSSGDIYVENFPISQRRGLARNRLGVCPQFDCCDQMDVLEHLAFYARIRGVQDVQGNVQSVVRAVGLEAFQHRMAAKLSGGNKRKLSLGIALMGNPSVLLLDEPSSGMDVCAKRVMWRTLESVRPGRSLVLTTHSMEEADALATRAGILGGKMLAIGTSSELRHRHGNRYYVHLILKTAPHSSGDEMDRVKAWICERFSEAEVEDNSYHGQLRFSIPAGQSSRPNTTSTVGEGLGQSEKASESTRGSETKLNNKTEGDITEKSKKGIEDSIQKDSSISALFSSLEYVRAELGFENYSVSPTTLEQVFLKIVSKHNIEEEAYSSPNQERRHGKKGGGLRLVF